MIIYSVTKQHLASPKPDFYELRLDLRNYSKFKIPKFFYHNPSIITLRDLCEGGRYSGAIDQKLDFFVKLLEETNFYIDVELTHLPSLLKKLKNKVLLRRTIISVHDPSTFDLSNVKNIIQFVGSSLAPSVSEYIENCFFLKLALRIDTFSQLHAVTELLSTLKMPYTLISSGKLSLISRILYQHLGSVATYYGRQGALTAQNQITQHDVQMFNLVHIDAEARIGGVVGGSQVKNSLGLDFYNTYFRLHRKNAVYLPFAIEDCADFIEFIKKTSLPLLGFSITMPFKEEITKHIQTADPMINLWLPRTGQTFNTDANALIEAFKLLNITLQTHILLLGNGAMARLVRQLLPNNRFLGDGQDNTKFTADVCLINATPLGHRGEDVLVHYQLPPFNKVIDLPYTNSDTKLIAYCKKHNIIYIDGKTFWKMQAKVQLQLFLGEL